MTEREREIIDQLHAVRALTWNVTHTILGQGMTLQPTKLPGQNTGFSGVKDLKSERTPVSRSATP